MDLNPAEKQLRREALDRYALYAQLSAVVPVVLGMLYRVAKSTLKSRSKNAYSPVRNLALKNREAGGWSSTVAKVRWWLGEEMVPGKPMGTRDRKSHTPLTEPRAKLTPLQNGLLDFRGPHGCWCWLLSELARVSNLKIIT